MALIEPQRALPIINRLLELTDEGKLEWDTFEFDDEELVAYSDRFKYYIAHASWRDAPYRLQVWKLRADPDGNSVQVDEIDSSGEGLMEPLKRLYDLANRRKTAVAAEELANDILDDLG